MRTKKSNRAATAWLLATALTVGLPQLASAQSVLRFSNAGSAGLGDALPGGVVRVYVRDARGQPQCTGENRIEHTPQGSTIALPTGDAFDVKVQPTTVSRTRLSSDRWRTVMRYTLTNARARPVTVESVARVA